MLSPETELKIEKLIDQENLVPSDVLKVAKTQAEAENKTLIQVLSETNAISEDQSTKIIAFVSKIPFVDLVNLTQPISQETLELVPVDIARTYMAVPFGITDGKLNVAMVDPTNLMAIDFLTHKTGYNINAYMATKSSIENILAMYKENFSEQVEEALGGVTAATQATKEETKKKPEAKSVEILVQEAPITRALNAILDYAVKSKASDIHIEPRENELKVRFRIDGILHDTMTLPKNIEAALISRIKILSDLKIDEHRIPQDGEAQIKVNDREIDLRLAIAPITYGEQVVIRVLDKSSMGLNLDQLGFRGRAYRLLKSGMTKPHGMILSTGPTGSGKSTTLYAIIQEIKSVAINIITLEDPVEYKIDGINQIQINPGIGLTFANGLRSVLRQDPNVIMVGEIRDRETADLAVQSALTGHIVLSTLHTNSAAGVLPRLLDMKIDPFLIASTVNSVVALMIVRTICTKC
ncbi:MAG: GspE/PulE family protein, partial [bacterium]|nr:GspE/PulE family protein [bacterium]